ncbi:hypothetical protein [Sphingomonas sp. SUN039]|uniref:hypothetical protein n=1 Tax=Sphingomonas sp. SUN039 TaxID=2937787 RepID=UPI0021644D41|nr:hypothetical protein [Sphingomonas sp. SUN039]UVO54720.1 hypothetical protein M0209_11520 [Sphingomonas sp. SUN039]
MTAPHPPRPDNQGDATDAATPRAALNIGVTGHRLERLGDVDPDRLRIAIAGVLADIEAASGERGTVALTMVSSIADGADSIAARAALARGWALDVVLPFAADDYARDFAKGAARTTFEEERSAARAVFELPGIRDAGGEAAVAYERAGRVVLTQCDMLIAVWDGEPLRGRGGAAQIVAEAVASSIPVVHIDPRTPDAPHLLWSGLEAHDLGQQTVETVPREGIAALETLVRDLCCVPDDAGQADALLPRWSIAFAWPLFLTLLGIRRVRVSDMVRPRVSIEPATGPQETVQTRFANADAVAAHAAQLFRSGYVMNFSFAALAVILSLLGFVLPAATKPVLVVLELLVIGTILGVTWAGNRAGWHRRWLDSRNLAERLRCLNLSADVGDLDLRTDGARSSAWVGWQVRATARALGLPSARVDGAYLARVRDALSALIDGQVAYLSGDAKRMHRLEHRLHRLGLFLFGATALVCVLTLTLKAASGMGLHLAAEPVEHSLAMWLTIGSAALPAMGAAIYGIRMQGDFAGIAERNEALVDHLASLRRAIDADALDFDTLRRRVRRATDLLTTDLDNWLQTYHARPLALPG